MWFIVPVIVAVSMVDVRIAAVEADGVYFQLDGMNKCQYLNSGFLTITKISISTCVKECLKRPMCTGLGFWQRFTICELYSQDLSTATLLQEQCVLVNRSSMIVQTGWALCGGCVFGQSCEVGGEHTCQFKECAPLVLNNGDILGNVNSVRARKKFTCHAGYRELNDTTTNICQDDGSWSYAPTCERLMLLGETCVTDFECSFSVVNSTCQNDSSRLPICRCLDDNFDTNGVVLGGYCSPKIGISQACPYSFTYPEVNPAMCEDPRGECRHNICQCEAGFALYGGSNVCRKIWELGEDCNNDTSCTIVNPESSCVEDIAAVYRCRCLATHYDDNGSYIAGLCVERIANTETCPADPSLTNVCEDPLAECQASTCQCQTGFALYDGSTICRKIWELGEDCDNDTSCMIVNPESSCWEDSNNVSRCRCLDTHYDDNGLEIAGSCIERIANSQSCPDDQSLSNVCADPLAECRAKKCQCQTGYALYGGSIVCRQIWELGEVCSIDSECTIVNPEATCHMSGVCRCPFAYYDDNGPSKHAGACVERIANSEKCPDEPNLSKVCADPQAECRAKKCQCQTGYALYGGSTACRQIWKLGEDCDSDSECTIVNPESRCDTSVSECSCLATHFDDNGIDAAGSCVEKKDTGEECPDGATTTLTYLDICNDPLAECFSSSGSKTYCRCRTGYDDTGTGICVEAPIAFTLVHRHHKSLSAGQTLSYDTDVTISAYADVDKGVFTCTRAGLYKVQVYSISYDDSAIYFALYKNTQIMATLWGDGADEYTSAGNAAVLALSVGDTLTVVCRGSSRVYGESDDSPSAFTVIELEFSTLFYSGEQVAAFSASLNVGKNVEGNHRVEYNHYLVDTEGGYSTSTGIYTVRKGGIYIFHFFSQATLNQTVWQELEYNNNYVCSIRGTTSNNERSTEGNSVILRVQTRDTVSVKAHTGVKNWLYGNSNEIYSTFTGVQISKSGVPIVAFSVGVSSTKTLENKATIVFNHVFMDETGGAFQHHTGKFVCPTPGLYEFNFHAGGVDPVESTWIDLFHDSRYVTSLYEATTSYYRMSGSAAVLKLDTGDSVYLKSREYSVLFGSASEIYCTFSGYLVHAW